MAVRETIRIHTETIALDALLKWTSIVTTGGQAKQLILAGGVRVNGTIERRRGHRVRVGDVVEIGTRVMLIGQAP